jgi:hypothetical protein
MTVINQDFSYPELEAVINNVSEKTVAANEVDEYSLGWFIVSLIIYTVAAVMQLIQFKRNSWNELHLALLLSVILAGIAHALTWTEVIEAFFLFSVAKSIMIMVPACLLYNWLGSMVNRHQDSHNQPYFISDSNRKRYIIYFWIWTVLFTISELLVFIFCILWITPIWYEYLDYYYEIWYAVCAVEITGFVFLLSLCAWILLKFQNVVDPKIIRKRRQLLTILLIYLSLIALLSALATRDYVSPYIAIISLIAYFVLTFFPKDAITGFKEEPSQPTATSDQPTAMAGQPS